KLPLLKELIIKQYHITK
ncbi:hypothetical protein EC950943_4121B, partial [Escherichia coli 95.0943]